MTFLEKEKEKSDLYIFMQLFCSGLYNKYVKVDDKNSTFGTFDNIKNT
jgi:hypothetical protein